MIGTIMTLHNWIRQIFARQQSRKRTLARKLSLLLEHLEQRLQPSITFRTIDGSNNNSNTANSSWGSANTDLIRVSPAAYTDGMNSPSLSTNQSARVISNI